MNTMALGPMDERTKEDSVAVEQYHRLFERNPHPMWIYDTESLAFLAVNEAAILRYGYSREEFLSMTIGDIRPPEDLARLRKAVSEVRDSGALNVSTNWRHRTKAGEIIDVEISGAPMTWEGRPAELIAVRDVTEAKAQAAQREHLLSELSERVRELRIFRAIFEASRDGIVVEHNETILYANRAYADLFGYESVDELVGQHVSIVQSESDNRRMLEFGRLRLEGGDAPTLYEFQGKRKNGDSIDLEASVSTFEVEGQQLIVALVRDIRDRKSAEQALEESEERYRKFFDNDLSGNFISTPRGRLVACNTAFARIFGFAGVDEALTADMKSLYQSGEERELYIRRLQAERKIEGLRRTMKRRDGTEVETISNVSGEFDESGRLLLIKGYILDVTAQKRAFQRLEEQAALLDVTRDATIVRKLDDTITLWNKAAERLYGWSRKEAIGRRVTDLLSEEELPLFRKAKEAVLEHGEWNGEYEQTSRDGRRLTLEARWTLIRDEHGDPHSILVVDTDVTEQRAFQKQAIRTQRLESLGTLAGGIAHDLNNVLGPILMGTEVLKKRVQDPGSIKLLESMEKSALRGGDMVKQVLAFARGLDGERVVVQTKHIIQEIATFVSETFPKSIVIRKDLQKNVPPVLGDATQIHQVLLNLAVNARDAMPNGGTLTFGLEAAEFDEYYCTMHPEVQPGTYATLIVRDSGMGIAPEVADRIFDPFFTTKEDGKGTGLGLSTVMGIVRSHGGFVTVESKPGQGAEFRVYLPATTELEKAAEQEALEAGKGRGETVLLVDDEPSIREATQTILEANGYAVLTAAEGTEALAVYSKYKDKIAVVITDLAMPVMDGLSTIRAIQYLNPGLPVIACSGLSASPEQFGPSVRTFLQKPFTATRLLTAVREALETVEPSS